MMTRPYGKTEESAYFLKFLRAGEIMDKHLKKPASRFLALSMLLIAAALSTACEKKPEIDSDGGYYDEKSQTYKYVWVGRKTVKDDPQGITKPMEGLIQQVKGKVKGLYLQKAVWLEIPERQTYMILAGNAARFTRDDKNKRLLFFLRYIDPTMIGFGSKKFRTQWKKYVTSKMEQELLNKEVVITFGYERQTEIFRGVITLNLSKDTENPKFRNINLWMIENGLSNYFFDPTKTSELHESYLKAEKKARKEKKGLWRY